MKKRNKIVEEEKTVVPAEKVGAETVTSKGKTVVPKKAIFTACGIVAAIAVIVLVVVLIVNRDNSEKVMTKQINDLGVTFYEEFYYKSAGSGDKEKRDDFLGRFTDIGIKVSLENLVRYYVTTSAYTEIEGALVDGTVAERVEDLTKQWFTSKKYNCNQNDTKVIIYPTSPFGEKDYRIEVVTACGFDSENTEEGETTTVKTTKATTVKTTKAAKKAKENK